MDRRYEYMQDPERFRFGANALTYGLNPVFLIFDEVAAFKAGADKKTFAEVWDNLTQLVLARAANVFVILAMQQPRADTISTDIRDIQALACPSARCPARATRWLSAARSMPRPSRKRARAILCLTAGTLQDLLKPRLRTTRRSTTRKAKTAFISPLNAVTGYLP